MATCTKQMQMHTRDGGTMAVKFDCFRVQRAGGPGALEAPAEGQVVGLHGRA